MPTSKKGAPESVAEPFATDRTFSRRRDDGGEWIYDDGDADNARRKSWEYFHFDLVAFDDYLNGNGWTTEKAAAVRRLIVRARADAIESWRTTNLLAAEGWLNYLAACKQMHEQREWLLPLARRGDKFKGNGRGAGPVRKAIARTLQRHPAAKPIEIWELLKAKPPRGLTFFDVPRFGKYIETTGALETKYARFANIVSEERKKL